MMFAKRLNKVIELAIINLPSTAVGGDIKVLKTIFLNIKIGVVLTE